MRVGLVGFFEAAIWVQGEALSIGCVHWTIDWPGPAPESSSLVVDEGLSKASFIVHDKGTLLGDGLTDWTALQDQAIGTTRGLQGDGKV